MSMLSTSAEWTYRMSGMEGRVPSIRSQRIANILSAGVPEGGQSGAGLQPECSQQQAICESSAP